MNRSYAIPAAIALTAHALLFVGSSNPPVKPPVVAQKVTPPVNDPLTIFLKPEPPANPEEGSDDKTGRVVEAPPGIIEIPPSDNIRRVGIEQVYAPVNPGKATKVEPGAFGPPGGESGKKPFSVSSLDEPPRTRFQKAPVYPNGLKNTGVTGTVWVEFLVDEGGRVHDVQVIKSTNSGFDDATLAAVSQWRFESGKRKGIPVRFRMSIPIVFNLSD